MTATERAAVAKSRRACASAASAHEELLKCGVVNARTSRLLELAAKAERKAQEAILEWVSSVGVNA